MITVNVKKLEEQLNEAVEDYKRKVNDTCDIISDPNCREAIRNLSDDVGHCLCDFESAILGFLKEIK